MKREEIIQSVNDKFTEMSTEMILFHQAVADVVGMNITDHKCLHFIHIHGAVPAGRLAELTGLTTGAITGIIDRLEKAGYVSRTSDPKDRRRTIVEPIRNKKLEKNSIRSLSPSTKKCTDSCLHIQTASWLCC